MRHLDEGTLRRLVDEPFSISSAAREHVNSCASCREQLECIARDASAVARIFERGGDPAVDERGSYARVRARIAAASSKPFYNLFGWRIRRTAAPLAAGLVAAAAVILFLFTPVGTLAQSFLTIFEPRQFVAIPVTRADFAYLPDLQSFGTITSHTPVGADGRPLGDRDVAGPAQAAALTGMPIRLPAWLPPNIPRQVRYHVVPRGEASFTFSAAKARSYEVAARRTMPPMPSGLDGSKLTLHVGPLVVNGFGPLPEGVAPRARRAVRKEEDSGDIQLPTLVIVQGIAPRVTSTGATVRDIENYLLQMPGVAPQLADEIRAIGDPATTMPIPVPVDKAFAQNVAVDGAAGLAVGDDTGVGGMIVWQKNGIVYGVGGALPQRELMEVAQSLR